MSKKLTVAAVAVVTSGLIVANVVSAQTWGGFYVDGALGARGTTTDIDRSLSESGTFLNPPNVFSFSNINTKTNDQGKTNFLGQLSGGWRRDNGKIVVGIGAFFDLASDDAGEGKEGNHRSQVISGPGFSKPLSESGYDKFEVKQKNRYGISLDIGPSWRTQPYAKLAYAWSDVEYRDATSHCGEGLAGPTSFSFSNTYSGFGVGGGVRHRHNDNLYFFAEAMWQDLGSKKKNAVPLCGYKSKPLSPGEAFSTTRSVKVSPSNLTGVIGVGWSF